MNDHTDTDRDRALFDPVDRKYLTGQREYDIPQQRYRREGAIRDRLTGGVLDLQLFQQRAGERLFQKLIPEDSGEQRQLRDGIAGAIALFFELHQAAGWDFENTITRGVEEAYTYAPPRRGTVPRRKVTGETSLPDTRTVPDINELNQQVKDKIRAEEMLTDREVRHAVMYGDMGVQRTLSEYLRERDLEASRDSQRERVWTDIKQFGEETFFPDDVGDTDDDED